MLSALKLQYSLDQYHCYPDSLSAQARTTKSLSLPRRFLFNLRKSSECLAWRQNDKRHSHVNGTFHRAKSPRNKHFPRGCMWNVTQDNGMTTIMANYRNKTLTITYQGRNRLASVLSFMDAQSCHLQTANPLALSLSWWILLLSDTNHA